MATRITGRLTCTITFDKKEDRYRARFVWPEMANPGPDGEPTKGKVKHERYSSIQATRALVALTNVSKPTEARAIERACLLMIRTEFLDGLARFDGKGNIVFEKGS